MTDKRIRDLQRLVAQGQAPMAALLMERVRVGELPAELVRFAIILGNQDAIDTGLKPLHMGAVVKTNIIPPDGFSSKYLLLGKAVWAIVELKYNSFEDRKLAAVRILSCLIAGVMSIGVRPTPHQSIEYALNIIARYLTNGTTPNYGEEHQLLLALGGGQFNDVIVQTALVTRSVNNSDLKANLTRAQHLNEWPDQELRGPVTGMCCRILAEAALA